MRRTSRLLRAASLVAVLAGVFVTVPRAAVARPDPITCRGYGQKRVFLEGQGWWTRPRIPVGRRSEHVHVGTCFPWRQTLSGTVRFDVLVKLHGMRPGARLKRTRIHTYNESGTTLLTINWRNYVCRSVDCTLWRTVYVNTRRSPYDGRQEFRFLTKVVRPNGKEIIVSTRWQAYLRNGKPVRHYRPSDNYMGAAGWYTNRGYQSAVLSSGIPRGPVSGIWRPSVKLKRGSDGLRSSRHVVSVDANLHAGLPGRIVNRGRGEFRGRVTIDTRNLANGIHRLFLRVDQTGRRRPPGTVSGAFVVPFVVRN